MKLHRFTTLVLSMLLVGCGTSNSSVLPTSSEESSVVASSSTSSSKSSSSAPLPVEVKNSRWGMEAAKACYDTIGVVIPFMESDGFEYEVTTDDFGDPAVWFYLYYETQEIAEQKVVDYAYAAYEQDSYACVVKPTRMPDPNGYSYFITNVLYADKELSDINAVEIQGLDSIKTYKGKSMGCLGLFCFNYIPVDENNFPEYAAETITYPYQTLPELTGNDYKYSFAFFMYNKVKCLEIVIQSNSKSYELEELYFYQLLDKGFTILQYDDLIQGYTDVGFHNSGTYPEFTDNLCYYALSKDSTYYVYFDYDLYNNALYIDVFPSWAVEE